MGEDGPVGLNDASRNAIENAEIIFGAPRHLELVGADDRAAPWPVPFSLEPVLENRGKPAVMLVSGDPFWFGAGSTVTRELKPDEWLAYPGLSTFSLAASRLGWPLEETSCIALHARPFESVGADLQDGAKLICLLRDGAAVHAFSDWICEAGFPGSALTVLEALGGPNERVRHTIVSQLDFGDISHPVAVALSIVGKGLTAASGLDDGLFSTDGQMTKRPVRALALSALAPRNGELLWDIGAGSGTIAVEWLRAGPRCKAVAVEKRPDRGEHIRANAKAFGVSERMEIHQGEALAVIARLPAPDAVFVGGGADMELFEEIWRTIPAGTRLVMHAVTLETERLLTDLSAQHGGELLRIEIARNKPLGPRQVWQSALPIVEWSVVK